MYNTPMAENVIFTSFLTVDDHLNTELVHTLFSLLLFALQKIKSVFILFMVSDRLKCLSSYTVKCLTHVVIIIIIIVYYLLVF